MDNTESPAAPALEAAPPRARRAPPGWIAPGPAGSAREVPLDADEDLSWLAGDWRIVQRRDGHRWSLDDLVTAFVAQGEGRRMASRGAADATLERAPRRLLDLGTGIGSVALMLAWSFPDAHVTGIEAQEVSHRLSLKSVFANELEARTTFVLGDLRDVVHADRDTYGGAFDLVTGTPPYFDDPAQTRSLGVQKGPCRFEERGSIVDYLAAMRVALAPAGRAVICHASRHRARVLAALDASGLATLRRLEVVPKVGRDALVDVFVLAHPPAADPAAAPLAARDAPGAADPAWERLTVRDASDQWTADMRGVRLALGMPPGRT